MDYVIPVHWDVHRTIRNGNQIMASYSYLIRECLSRDKRGPGTLSRAEPPWLMNLTGVFLRSCGKSKSTQKTVDSNVKPMGFQRRQSLVLGLPWHGNRQSSRHMLRASQVLGSGLSLDQGYTGNAAVVSKAEPLHHCSSLCYSYIYIYNMINMYIYIYVCMYVCIYI